MIGVGVDGDQVLDVVGTSSGFSSRSVLMFRANPQARARLIQGPKIFTRLCWVNCQSNCNCFAFT